MSTVYSPHIVRDGLTMYLDSANVKSYPKDGSLWYDLIGTNDGSIQGNIVFSEDNSGILLLNGDDYVILNSQPTDSTICFWFKTTSATEQIIIGGIYANNICGIQLKNNKLAAHEGTGVSLQTVRNDLNDGQWRFTSVVYTGDAYPSNFKIYFNGIEQALEGNGPYRYCSPYKLIGCRYLTNPPFEYFFNGSLSSFMFYNRILSDSEIKQNYNALKTRFGL